MNWEQLRAWVNDLARTPAELDDACAGLVLVTGGTVNVMRARLLDEIDAQPDLTTASSWTPLGWTPPAGTAATAPAGAPAAAAATPPPPATPPPAVPAGAPAPAAAAPAPAPTPVAAATPPPVHHGWRERFTGDGGGLLSVGAIVLTAFVLWLVIWGIDWDNPFSDDEGVQVITTDAATPVAGDDGESVSLLDDPRVVEIRERIESGEIKTVDDLQSAVEDADFNEEEWIQIREELAPNGQLVAPAPSNGSATDKQPPLSGDDGRGQGAVGQAGQSLEDGLSNKPTDLEALPRSTVKAAPLGQWFHPIYKSSTYQSSGGKDGQWSWAHTLFLGQATGGNFIHFEGNDGSFNFRHSDVHADVSFAVLTTSEWKSQFMEGDTSQPFGLNVRALPGTTVTVYGENGKVLGSQAVSRAGDLTIIMPDDGVTGVSLSEDDPPKTFEVKVWVGPYDRSEGINTFDARSQAVSR